jgi:hypothetical protein
VQPTANRDIDNCSANPANVRLLLPNCPNNMKTNFGSGVSMVRRPIALMLALLPAGALAFSYCVVQWTSMMTANGRIDNPDLAMTIGGFGTLFRDYAIPVLTLSVVLALANLWCTFAVRAPEGKVH